MEFIILPVATMAIGFLLGIITADTIGGDKRIDKMERQIKRLERRLEV